MLHKLFQRRQSMRHHLLDPGIGHEEAVYTGLDHLANRARIGGDGHNAQALRLQYKQRRPSQRDSRMTTSAHSSRSIIWARSNTGGSTVSPVSPPRLGHHAPADNAPLSLQPVPARAIRAAKRSPPFWRSNRPIESTRSLCGVAPGAPARQFLPPVLRTSSSTVKLGAFRR